MPQLGLHPDLSYCEVHDGLIFLDVGNDRYFRLPRGLESVLVTYMNGGNAPNSAIQQLVERKVLVNKSVDLDYVCPSSVTIPTRSAMEDQTGAKPTNASALLDVLAVVCSIQLQLKVHSLKRVVRKLAAFRRERTPLPRTSRASEADVLEAAAVFRSARLYVPLDMCCLLDSVAMIKFLAKRKLHACLVFGVTGTPFSAHCWAQHGTTVLNDALGHTLAFTPIRVV